ncbi:MAG: hypothetical protein J7578_23070 [Chitinophagaceae bacterium]|nr:hypothetical protein [Chitinophagaceae bacterium]
MHTSIWEQDLLCYRIRSERRRKRDAKKDKDKQLIRLYGEEWRLRRAIDNLPWVPLEQPYQKGWKRFFVLHPEVKRTDRAGFYEALLKKINSVQYKPDKTFTIKKRRKGKKYSKKIGQSLRSYSEYDWHPSRCKLTEAERRCFHKEEYWDRYNNKISYRYVVSEPWRFVLQIRPHMITKIKMIDGELESNRQQLENHLRTYHLWPGINRLIWGKNEYWRKDKQVSRSYKTPPKLDPVHLLIERAENEKIEQAR